MLCLLHRARRLPLALAPARRLPALEDRLYHYFRASWRVDGTWERLHRALRERTRVRLGRNPQPTSAGIVDSQSVKTPGIGGRDRGYDGAKRRSRVARSATCWWIPKGWGSKRRGPRRRERFMDRDGIKSLLERVKDRFPRLSHLWLDDAGYTGEGKGKDWVEKTLGWTERRSYDARPSPATCGRRKGRSRTGKI